MRTIISLLSLFLILAGAPAAAATYQYDANGQLVSVAYTPGRKVIYSYDAAGNRTNVEVSLKTGDINGDGNLDITDAIMILQITTRSLPSGLTIYSDIDVNGNQIISMDDALFIIQKIAGIR